MHPYLGKRRFGSAMARYRRAALRAQEEAAKKVLLPRARRRNLYRLVGPGEAPGT